MNTKNLAPKYAVKVSYTSNLSAVSQRDNEYARIQANSTPNNDKTEFVECGNNLLSRILQFLAVVIILALVVGIAYGFFYLPHMVR